MQWSESSLASALNGLGNNEEKPEPRPAGIILAVRIANPVHEKRVITTLQAGGAVDIEEAEGEWRDGDWTDFNPVVAPQLVESASH